VKVGDTVYVTDRSGRSDSELIRILVEPFLRPSRIKGWRTVNVLIAKELSNGCDWEWATVVRWASLDFREYMLRVVGDPSQAANYSITATWHSGFDC
jgi:hypothetical protein